MDFTDQGPAMSQAALRDELAELGHKIAATTCGRVDLRANPPTYSEASGYSWAATYSAGSDAMVYRRFKGPLPSHAANCAAAPPARIVAFCEEHNCDVALYDELRGVVRKPKLGTDEAP